MDATRRAIFFEDCGGLGGCCMSDDRNHFVVMRLCIAQDIRATMAHRVAHMNKMSRTFGRSLSRRYMAVNVRGCGTVCTKMITWRCQH
jgi:hypothetical protein